jgi:2-dehydro-3-deoxyglucarate aldolase
VRYPPRGRRGVGLARAQGYGASFPEYREWLDGQAVVVVQVEHIRAVENLAHILAVEGVDAFIIGPYDLSGSLGVPGRFEDPAVAEALSRIARVAAEMGKRSGLHIIEPDEAALARAIQAGHRFLAYSLDIRMLDRSCRAGLAAAGRAG